MSRHESIISEREVPLDPASFVTPSTDSARSPVRSYQGWALEQALAVDDVVPGFLGASCRWGTARRQVAFFVLASLRDENAINVVARRLDGALLEAGVDVDAARAPRSVVGHALLTLRPRKVLRAALGGLLPPGLAGTLDRLGPDPLSDPLDYAEIVRLFRSDDPGDRARVRVLGQHSGLLAIGQIRALTVLEPALVHRAVLRHICDLKSAETFVDAVAYLRRCCSAATDDALRASLDAWPADKRLKVWLRRWSDRFDRPPALDGLAQALARYPDVKLLATGADLIAAGRRHNNCLAQMVPEVLAGRHGYVEYRPNSPGAQSLIGELRWTDSGYVLERIHRTGHRLGPEPGSAVLRNRLRAAGVMIKGRAPVSSRMRAAMAAWLNIYPGSRDEAETQDDTLDDFEECA